MDTIGFVFGITGMSLGMMGFIFGASATNQANEANGRIEQLENRLRDSGVLDRDSAER